MFTINHLAVFRLPPEGGAKLAAGISPTSLNIPILEPEWLYMYEGQDLHPLWKLQSRTVFTRTFQLSGSDKSRYVEFATKELALTLRIPEEDSEDSAIEVVEQLIPLSISIDFAQLLPDREVRAFRPSATHFVTASIRESFGNAQSHVSLDLTSRSLLPYASVIATIRLGMPQHPPLSISVSPPGACEPSSVDYDAWSGIVLLAWQNELNSSHVTTWTMSRLRGLTTNVETNVKSTSDGDGRHANASKAS
jgi:hypothetical protein